MRKRAMLVMIVLTIGLFFVSVPPASAVTLETHEYQITSTSQWEPKATAQLHVAVQIDEH